MSPSLVRSINDLLKVGFIRFNRFFGFYVFCGDKQGSDLI